MDAISLIMRSDRKSILPKPSHELCPRYKSPIADMLIALAGSPLSCTRLRECRPWKSFGRRQSPSSTLLVSRTY